MAAQAMFNIAFAHADCLRDGWRHLLDYVARLHRIQALPLSLLERDDFVDLQGNGYKQVKNIFYMSAGFAGRW